MSMGTSYFHTGFSIFALIAGIFLLLGGGANAQQNMPRPITVSFNPGEGLRFGSFYQTPTGGSVIVSPDGVRTFTGAVIGADLGAVYDGATFQIDAEPGTLIHVLNGPDATLTGSAGGTMNLHIGSSYPSSPFIATATSPATTAVKVGGTLTVGGPAANPSGSYSGTFSVTFIVE